VETTVENARLSGPREEILIDGQKAGQGGATWKGAKWAALSGTLPGAGLGWVFLDGNTPFRTLLETRTGSRADITRGAEKTPLTLSFATLWFDHGKGVRNGSYAYVTLPGRDAAAVRQYAVRPALEIRSNSPELQAVRDSASGISGIVGWKPGSVDGVKFDQPGIFVIRRGATGIMVAISDPTMRLEKPLRLVLDLNASSVVRADPGIRVISQAPLELEVDLRGALGQTRQAVFACGH
jgi:hyaluronate lyase